MKIVALSLLVIALGFANVGCSASASIRKADATRVSPRTQIAYTTSPSR